MAGKLCDERKEELICSSLEILKKIKEKSYLIHVIPNVVSAVFVADAISAIGARPVMAWAKEEMEDIVSHADGLVVNTGQPTVEKNLAVIHGLKIALEHKIPIVLDPVGSGASHFRSNLLQCIMNLPFRGIVKGNYSEIENISREVLQFQGVDSITKGAGFPVPVNQEYIYGITGNMDFIVSSNEEICLMPFSNTIPCRVVGTGCVTSGLTGVFMGASRKKEESLLLAMTFMKIAHMQAGEENGYGTYKLKLLDALSMIEENDVLEYLKQYLQVKKR